MTIATIQQLAIGMISLPQRPQHHEAMLASATSSAIATYSATHPHTLRSAITATGTTGQDELGPYTDFTLPATSRAAYASHITAGTAQPDHTILTISASTVSVRLRAALPGPQQLTIWAPAPYTPESNAWPEHHEPIIALITAGFYLNAVALSEPDNRRAELIQSIAASYYGRAMSTLQQIRE